MEIMKKSKVMNERVRKIYWSEYIHDNHNFKSFEEFCKNVNQIVINGLRFTNRRCIKAIRKQDEIKSKWQQ